MEREKSNHASWLLKEYLLSLYGKSLVLIHMFKINITIISIIYSSNTYWTSKTNCTCYLKHVRLLFCAVKPKILQLSNKISQYKNMTSVKTLSFITVKTIYFYDIIHAHIPEYTPHSIAMSSPINKIVMIFKHNENTNNMFKIYITIIIIPQITSFIWTLERNLKTRQKNNFNYWKRTAKHLDGTSNINCTC